jgi:hypothetical protein
MGSQSGVWGPPDRRFRGACTAETLENGPQMIGDGEKTPGVGDRLK